VRSIVESARKFLIAAQDPDGFWRDYVLPPGMSTAWTTASVAFALGPQHIGTDRARDALLSDRRPSGWGYNSSVSTDADSTACVLRFMAAANDPCVRHATALLKPFITACGGARTFRDAHPFGRWAQEHADVTPVVGLALVECGGHCKLIESMRDWCIAAQQEDGSWASFWWKTDVYATAKMIEFLAALEMDGHAVLRRAAEWILDQRNDSSPFEAAHALAAFAHSGLASHKNTQVLVDFLCDLQQADGSWPGSRVLLVPDQHRDDVPPSAFEDCRRLMTTAACLQALSVFFANCA
jgi:squalene cyclase